MRNKIAFYNVMSSALSRAQVTNVKRLLRFIDSHVSCLGRVLCGARTFSHHQFVSCLSWSTHCNTSCRAIERPIRWPRSSDRECCWTKSSRYTAPASVSRRWSTSTSKSRLIKREASAEDPRCKWTKRTVDVPVGGNRNVVLDIQFSSHSQSELRERPSKSPDVFVYFPPGPLLRHTGAELGGHSSGSIEQEHDDVLCSIGSIRRLADLKSDQPAPVVIRINYRLSSHAGIGASDQDHRFPLPIHDVSMAFDWILQNRAELRPSQREFEPPDSDAFEADEVGPHISLFGSHIGGSLALMLSLTHPNAIHAVAIRDPLVDWVGLDELAAPVQGMLSTSQLSRGRGKTDAEASGFKTQEAAQAVIDLRTALFRNPSGFFDAFASPLLFLRAPGRDTPPWRTARPEIEHIGEANMSITEAMKQEGGAKIDERHVQEVVRERGYGPYDDDWHTADHEIDISGSGIEDIDSSTTKKSLDTEQATRQSSSSLVADEQAEPRLKQPQTDLSTSRTHPHDIPKHSENPDHNQSSSSLQPCTNLFAISDIKPPSPASPEATPTDSSTSTPARRRKVLRRWPPIGRPEDVELPYTKIFSTTPGPPSASLVDLAYVLHPRAKEMVNVMRRACFWGREKSVGEARVIFETVAANGDVKEEEKDQESAEAIIANDTTRKPDYVVHSAVKWLAKIAKVEK